MKIGTWHVDLELGVLREGKARRVISPRSRLVLEHLIGEHNRVVESSTLLEKFWRGPLSAENALTKSISELRQAFGDSPKKQSYIRTVSKRGYMLIADLELPQGTSAGEARAPRHGSPITSNINIALNAVRDLLCIPTSTLVNAAEVQLRQLIDETDNGEACLLLIDVLLLRSEYGDSWWALADDAETLLTQAEIRSANIAEIAVRRARLLYKQAKEVAALEVLKEALVKVPEHSGLIEEFVKAQQALGEFSVALEACGGLLVHNAHQPGVNMLMAELSAYNGATEQAQSYFQRAMLLAESDPGIHLRAGNFEIWINKNYLQAFEHYSAARQLDPGDIRAPTRLMSLMLFVDLKEEMDYWRDIAEEINPNTHALSFWHRPDAEISLAAKRRYIDNVRQQQPNERDWLRVSGELEMQMSKRFIDQPEVQRACLERAYQFFLEYLSAGDDIELDSLGNVRFARVRMGETQTMSYFCRAAAGIGNTDVALQVMTRRLQYLRETSAEQSTTLQLFAIYTATVATSDAKSARPFLKNIGPQGAKLFDLCGLTENNPAYWQHASSDPEFKSYYQSAIDELLRVKAKLLECVNANRS